MPYPTNADLPEVIRQRYSTRCQTVFREVFNETQGDEAKRFRVAHTAGRNCMDSTATKAEWDYAYRRRLPDSAYACIDPGGEKDENGHTDEAHRHYPIRNVAGDLDAAHVRNALARLAQGDTTSCGAAKIRAAARELGIGEPAGKATAVKFVDGSDSIIEGLAIPYGGPFAGKDAHGEAFDADTDYALDWFPTEGRPTLYHHGMDDSQKTALVGRQIEREPLPVGQWARVELDKRNKYLADIQGLVDEGALSFSSGAIPHLVKTRADGHIERWPWVELSLTPTPANLDAAVYAVKSADAIEHLTAVKAAEALKFILAREPDLESESFAAQAERVTAGLDEFLARVDARHLARTKSGRSLSAANRTELAEVIETIDHLAERRAHLADLLARTDPAAAEAAKVAEQEYLRFLREQARQNGVRVDA